MTNRIPYPKMIVFDYGETLIHQAFFDGIKGTEAVLQYAVENKYQRTALQLQQEADRINAELGRKNPDGKYISLIEVPNDPFEAYLYESQGIRLSVSYAQAGDIFWDSAAPGEPTEGIAEFLDFLKSRKIRTGVISNLSFSGAALTKRIQRLLPENAFEFILTSSDYVFRKPSPRLFLLALEKAGLKPEDVWYIGDTVECDVQGALEAGLYPVRYTGAMEPAGISDTEYLLISAWSELEEILKDMQKE